MNRLQISANVVSLGLCFVGASTAVAAEQQTEQAAEPRARQFRLDYGATLKGLPQGARVRVWLPVPPSNNQQEIELLELDLPTQSQRATEPKYGNQIL